MGSEGNLASLSSPPDPLIGRTLAVVRRRPQPQLRLFFVIAAACLAVFMLLTVGAWAWTGRFPTPALVVTPAVILVCLSGTVNGVWNRPPLVVGEGGFEARWTLKRLQVVTWDEVAALVRDGNTLRVDLRDRKRFLQRRAGRTAFLRMPFRYPSLPLTMFDLPPTDVADLMLSSFDVRQLGQIDALNRARTPVRLLIGREPNRSGPAAASWTEEWMAPWGHLRHAPNDLITDQRAN